MSDAPPPGPSGRAAAAVGGVVDAGPAAPASTGTTIGIVDYGVGNRRSVQTALGRVGARAVVSPDRDELLGADGLVVPGVGAFPAAAQRLRASGLAGTVREALGRGIPVLGICVGMQLALERSTELGGADGLGIVPGVVAVLDAPGLKLPHIGWSTVTWTRPSPLTDGLPDPCAFYHVHSFVPAPTDADDVLGYAEYGTRFATALQRGDFYGVQFHPEKSSAHGLGLLSNFAAICARARAAVAAR